MGINHNKCKSSSLIDKYQQKSHFHCRSTVTLFPRDTDATSTISRTKSNRVTLIQIDKFIACCFCHSNSSKDDLRCIFKITISYEKYTPKTGRRMKFYENQYVLVTCTTTGKDTCMSQVSGRRMLFTGWLLIAYSRSALWYVNQKNNRFPRFAVSSVFSSSRVETGSQIASFFSPPRVYSLYLPHEVLGCSLNAYIFRTIGRNIKRRVIIVCIIHVLCLPEIFYLYIYL